MLPNTFDLNQFAPTNAAGFLDNPLNQNTMTRRIDPASTYTFIPGTAVTLTTTGTVVQSAATDNILGFVFYNEVYNTHTATVNFMVSIALQTSQMTLLAGAAIAGGDLLEYNPATNRVIPWAGTNTVIGKALQAVASGYPVLTIIQINQQS